MTTGLLFTPEDALMLESILMNRRDVRGNRFTQEPVSDADLDRILRAAQYAPSVGFSQPWQFVVITDALVKNAVKESFTAVNNQAVTEFDQDKQAIYNQLKLEGITEAPVNIAVFYAPEKGLVLGQSSMQEAGLYSVVCAVQNMWLMARSLNLGMGWVSILNPEEVKTIVHAPSDYRLVAYLCIGHVDYFLPQPELELRNWNSRKPGESLIHHNTFSR